MFLQDVEFRYKLTSLILHQRAVRSATVIKFEYFLNGWGEPRHGPGELYIRPVVMSSVP